MTSWALLLFASALLGTPGLAFSSLISESYDLETANLCNGEQFCQGLTQEGPQGDLLTTREELGITCSPCQKIIQKLEEMVGENPDKDTIAQAASRVCSKMRLLSSLCKKIIRKFLRRISQDIMAGKTPRAVCVDIQMCKRQAGFI